MLMMAAAKRTWAAWPVLRRRVTCFASAAVFLAFGPQKYLQYNAPWLRSSTAQAPNIERSTS